MSTPSSPKRTLSPKKSAQKTGKTSKAKARPTTSEMVIAAIGGLKERKGSSVPAIKKYIAQHYDVDMNHLAPFLKRYLRSGVKSGALKQTKGSGASGSFRLGQKPMKAKTAKAKAKKATKPRARKTKTRKPKKSAKSKAKKATQTKKSKPKKPKRSPKMIKRRVKISTKRSSPKKAAKTKKVNKPKAKK